MLKNKSGYRAGLKTAGFMVAVTMALLVAAGSARAALTVELVNGYNLVVDSNVTSPSTYAPRSAYIGARICNTGNDPLENVFVYVGDNGNGTPGLYPEVNTNVGTWPAHLQDTGTYSLTHEAGLADATRYVGTLAPGECRMQYWLISYPQCVNVNCDTGCEADYPPCAASITGGIKPDDDLTLYYDVWAKTSTSIATPTVIETGSLTMRSQISASANKIWPNTASKVPDEYLAAIESVLGWGTLGPDGQPLTATSTVYPGQRMITTQGIWYDLGNVNKGFDNDGDLIPDQNAWLQPVGDPGMFNADCFRMINVYGIVIVKLKGGGEFLIPFSNQLYFSNLPDNTGVVGLVYYQFIATSEGCSAAMTPYQESASGYDNEKFSADYGLNLNLMSASYGEVLTFTKSDGVATTSPGSTLTYEIAAENTSDVHLGAPDLGMPLMIRESIPAGTTYVAGSAATVNNVLPSGTGSYEQGFTDASGGVEFCEIDYNITSSTLTILYSTDNGATWSITEPAPAGDVTDIQWIFFTSLALDGGHDGNDCIAPDTTFDNGTWETSLPAGKSFTFEFEVTVNANPGPIVCNTAWLGYGGAVGGVEAADCTLVTGNNSLSGTVFVDDGGTNGIFGNGAQDGDESGIGAGVIVELYYDRNGDGQLDAGDIKYGETTTDAGGSYSFNSLPDGLFLVVAKKYDGPTSDGINNAVEDLAAGVGNTTRDPNLPLTTDQGIVKMTETLTQVILAVNIDLDGSESAAQTVSNVDFGFAPPLKLAKIVKGNATTVTEGSVFDYNIIIENRLPTVGVQGPTGCEYTVWSQNYTNGSPANKSFTNPEYAFDAASPNRTVASAVITGGGNRFIRADGFNHSAKPGNITKVEALIYAYYNLPLDDDRLLLTPRLVNTTGPTKTIYASTIDSYVGEPNILGPNGAISWNMTNDRPVAGDWAWEDFPNTYLTVDPNKSQGAETRTFYLDAVGIRVTTNTDCVAAPSTTLSPVPLVDYYDFDYFEFLSADPVPTSVDTSTGTIFWDNVGPILPGSSKIVTVTMRAKKVNDTVPGGLISGDCDALPSSIACNIAETFGVTYVDGRPANNDSDHVELNIQGKAEISGIVWSDTSNNGWPKDVSEPGLPNVNVSLYACVTIATGGIFSGSGNNKYCTGTEEWQIIATETTDENGNYEFIGLASGYYIVEVGDTNGAPVTGNLSPFGGVQTAEPNDNQATSGGFSVGTNGICQGTGGCNNTWGNPNARLRSDQTEINFLDASTRESVKGVNFGYYIEKSAVYGNIWHDVNGNAVQNPGEDGLAGFTVRLYTDDGAGNPDTLVDSTTTDADGNYYFADLDAGDYIIVVTPPAMRNNVWTEIWESTGGTGDLNNQIPVTVGAGVLSGSHDFAYTKKSVSAIGSTVFYDFNGNGSFDPGEAGIPGVTVYLYQDVDRDGEIDPGVDTIIAIQITDADGRYLFEDLPAGSYIVDVDNTTLSSNVTATADPDVNSAVIGGNVWLDANRDGAKDAAEEGIPEAVVLLYEDTDGDGILDPASDRLVAAAITNLNGEYFFTRLSGGDYFVKIDDNSLPAQDLILSTADPTGALINLADNTDSSSVLDVNAGYHPDSGYAMGNRVWSDAANYGVQDPGEAGIGGVTITVTDGTGTWTTTTDESGYWIVTGLPAGDYTITVDSADLPRNFIRTNGSGATDHSRTATITNADIMTVDFGYRYGGSDTPPTGQITGDVYLDAAPLEGIVLNLYDQDGNLVATTVSAADGSYSFTGVFLGIYMVEGIYKSGNYTTTFLASGEAYDGLDIVFNTTRQAIPDNMSGITVNGVHNDLMQNFGYQRFFGSIGDTIYLDVNENADQDFGEPGISGVTVQLYIWKDTNSDGVVDESEITLVQTAVTSADDPGTGADESGRYLFTNLPELESDQYYLVRVDTGTLPGSSFTLIGDPDADGVPCIDSSAPDGCDHQHVVPAFQAGTNYMGADFGYKIYGENYGIIAGNLWIDGTGTNYKDPNEPGLPFIIIELYDAVLNPFMVTSTNSDGEYSFTGLPDGTYYLQVNDGSPEWPSGLPTDPVFNRYDYGSGYVQVTISNGTVTTYIAGDPCTGTDCGINIDFAYRYSGTLTLSGTIGVDDVSNNGYLGAAPGTYSGVDSPAEAPLAGIQVYAFLWTDDGDNVAWDANGILDSGDSFVLLASTSTDANGDYSFSNLSDNVIVVASISESANLSLTTTNANSTATNTTKHQLYNGTTTYQGDTVTTLVRQALTLTGNSQGVDFAFEAKFKYDFGDLPANYEATLLAEGGPRHLVQLDGDGEPTSIILGTTITTENDGQPNANARGDNGGVEDDGVVLLSTSWTTGPDGASVRVTASAGGWLAGWIDFNRDGDFADAYERVINQPVSAGTQDISFFVPSHSSTGTYFARFRIYPEEPLFVSSVGAAIDKNLIPTYGEVEDYRWDVGVTFALISGFNAYVQSGQVVIEWETAGEVGTLGFYLERLNPASGKFKRVNRDLLPALLTASQGGVYHYVDTQAMSGGLYTYNLVEVEVNGQENIYGPFTVMTSEYASVYLTDDYDRKPHQIPEEAVVRMAAARENRKIAKSNNRKRTGNIVKLMVVDPGLYYLDAEEIADLFGVTLQTAANAIQSGHVALSHLGRDIAYDAVHRGEGLYFYGEAIDSIYTDENVYWLKSEKGRSMRRVNARKLPPAPAGQTFTAIAHREENQYVVTALSDPEADYWFWDYLIAGHPVMDAKSFEIPTTGIDAGSDATLTVRLLGGNDTPVNPDHHVVIHLNGTVIGEHYWDGITYAELTFPVDAAILQNSVNQAVTVTAHRDTGAPTSIVYVDSFALAYQRFYKAEQGVLTFRAENHATITVAGFDSPDVMVIDITDPKTPKRIDVTLEPEIPASSSSGSGKNSPRPNQGRGNSDGGNTTGSDGPYRFTIEPEPGAVYHAAAFTAARALADAWPYQSSRLAEATNKADYLLIAPAELMDAAARLELERRGQGLTTMLVNLEDIMDEFNGGIYSPWAIHDFLTAAYYQWSQKPQFVVLLGAGSFDYKDYMGRGDNLLPVLMAATPRGLFAADNIFGDVAGYKGVPAMAIGRIPVLANQELHAYIDKLVAYETAPAGDWARRIMMIADRPDSAGNFPADSNQLALIPTSSYAINKIYLSDLSLAEARVGILNGINAGVGFVSYIGHGGMDRLSQQGLLTSANVNAMNNNIYPVMNFMTCLTGRFEFPGFQSLAERLVIKEEGGALAVWSPTGLSVNAAAVLMADIYFRQNFVHGERYLGKAILKSLQEFDRQRNERYMLDIYNLLGDPALRMK